MSKLITGIHHISAMAGDAQENINFYTQFLGLRMVKMTVNYDDPSAYHFYYGDERAQVGNIITFFPYPKMKEGRQGRGMVNTTTFSLSINAMDFWLERFKRFGIPHKHPQERFDNEVFIYFEDKTGLGLELVFTQKDNRPGFQSKDIPPGNAIKGFYNFEVWVDSYVRTGAVLTQQLYHELIAEKGNRFRYAATDSPGNYVDLLENPGSAVGLIGTGVIHHIAFKTKDDETQGEFYKKISKSSFNPSLIKDRKYFKSVYFREPSGVLFEVATEKPGFTVDESIENLGTSLMLPERMEWNRAAIVNTLPKIKI